MAPAETLHVEVIWCPTPHDVRRVTLRVPLGTTAAEALEASHLLDNEPERSHDLVVGVWGRVASPSMALREGDRVEVYRPLTVDPMEARRRRHKG